MTVYGASDPQVIGQPISPFFGAQNGVKYAGPPIIQTPNANGSGPAKTALELVGTGSIPLNALVSTVNGVNVGGPAGTTGGDPCTVAELLSSGNGNQANGGVGFGAIPAQVGELQQVTVGLNATAMTENGPTPVNVDPLGIMPVPGGIAASSVVLVGSGFGG